MKSCLLYYLTQIICVAIFASCTSSQKLNYFNNLPDSTIVRLPQATKDERIVDIGDELEIVFNAKDPGALVAFNRQTIGTTSTGSNNESTGGLPHKYTVDEDGYIDLPVLHSFKVVGLTIRQIKTQLLTAVAVYLVEPAIDIKFTTFNVTLLGEVRSPGTYKLSGKRTTIFEALGAAGDVSNTAKKYNVRLYRDANGERTVTKINLTDKSFLYNKKVFQMKPNDVIYVQKRKGAVFQENFGLVASVVTIILSVVTLALTLKNQ
jgi:polysaccharide export outer membrane protein